MIYAYDGAGRLVATFDNSKDAMELLDCPGVVVTTLDPKTIEDAAMWAYEDPENSLNHTCFWVAIGDDVVNGEAWKGKVTKLRCGY